VENDEAMVRHNLSVMNESNVIIRIRGVKEEQTLTWDELRVGTALLGSATVCRFNKSMPSSALSESSGKFGRGWFNIGYNNKTYPITLQIEENITLDCTNLPFDSNNLRNSIYIFNQYASFIMEEGSKITNFTPRSTSSSNCIIMLDKNNQSLWLKGGEISNFKKYGDQTAIGFISLASACATYSFKKTGGTFLNNDYSKLTKTGTTVNLESAGIYDINKDNIANFQDDNS
jgi:hypothetical protein